MNLSKQFLGANSVDEAKIRLSNNSSLRARNAANSGDVNLIRLNATDQIMFGDVASPGWQKVSFPYSQFSDPSTTKTITLLTVPPGYYISQFFIKSTASFTGGAVSAVTLTTGIDSPTGLTSPYDLFTAPTGSAFVNFIDVSGALDFSAPHDIQGQVISTDDNLDQLTAGSFDFYYVIKNLNADAEIGAPGTSNGAKVFPPDLTMSGLTQMLFGAPDREFDKGNYVQSANTFTLSAFGIYLLAASGSTGTEGTQDDVVIGYKINGGPFRRLADGTNSASAPANLKLNGMTVEYLGPGDQITFWAQSSIDTTLIELEASVTALIGGFGLADGSADGASKDLSNLIATSINVALIPGVTDGSLGLGSVSNYWGQSQITALGDATGVVAVDVNGRVLRDSSGNPAIEWEGATRRLTNSAGQVVFEWDVGGEIAINKQTEVNPGIAFRWLAQDGNHAYGFIGPVTGGGTNVVWALPNADGSANQVLATDGSGILSWVTQTGGGGATTALDNLTTTSINTDLLPSNPVTRNIGSSGLRWNFGHINALFSAQLILDANSSWVTKLNGGSAQSADVILTLPSTVGTSGQSLISDGSGNMSWATRATAALDNLASTAVNTNINPATDIANTLGLVGQRWSKVWSAGLDSGSADLILTAHSTALTLTASTLKPPSDGSIDLGTASLRYSNLYANQVNGGNSTLAISSNSVQYVFDGTNSTFRANGNNTQDLGNTSNYWRVAYANTVQSSAALNLVSAATASGTVSGAVTLASGNQTGSAASGALSIKSGTTGTGDVSGAILIASGTSNNRSGDVSLGSGNVSGGGTISGNVTLSAGTATSTRGHIILNGLYIDASSTQIQNLADPSAAQHAMTKAYADANYIRISGATAFTGDQSMGSHRLTNLTDPSSAQDADTKAARDAAILKQAPTWQQFTFNFNTYPGATGTSFSTGIGVDVGHNRVIHGAIVKHTTPFSGGGITGYTVSISGNTWSTSAFDCFQSVTDAHVQSTQFAQVMDTYSGGVTLAVHINSTGANINQATAGSVNVWLLTSVVPGGPIYP